MQFKKHTLPNGLNIVTIPMQDNPAVTVFVMVETGSKYEKKETNGLSHFLEHMIFKGTPKRPRALDIAHELESIGAQYNAFTGQEYTGYYAKVKATDLDTALDVVSDIYLHPLFDAKEMEKEKGVIVEEIRMYQDMPHRHVQNLFLSLVYGDQPAGWNIAGTEQTVKSFTREDFVKYCAEHYVASATTVVVAGGFDEVSTVQKIEKAFEEIPTHTPLSKVAVVESQGEPRILVQYKETDQAHLVLGFRSYGARSKHDPALSVLSGILGKGMSSRLFQKLREEMGVGYYIYASHDAYTDHGLFSISAGIDTSRFDEVLAVLLDECKKLSDTLVDPLELKKVKDYLTGSFVLGLETSDSRAEYAAVNQIVKGEITPPEEEVSDIQKVTAEEVQAIAREIFIEKNMNLAVIGPYKDSLRFVPLLAFKK
ncbi:MAG: pitrilysin family protein [Patescibacteria group bacterium]